MPATILYNQSLSSIDLPDGLVVDVTTPKTGLLTSANIGRCAFVGTSTWGTPNVPLAIGSPRDQLAKIGPSQIGTYDLGTVVSASLMSGVSDNTVVRVCDGTQTAAIMLIAGATHAIATLTGICPGSYINGATAVLAWNSLTPVSAQNLTGNTQKAYIDLTIYPPNADPEVFLALDGNVFSTTYSIDGPTLGAAIIAAVNNGQQNGRGPSQWFVATAGVSTPGAPVMLTPNVVSTAGTDGNTFGGSPTITAAQIGSQASNPWTGMYALAGKLQGATLTLVGNSNLSSTCSPSLLFAKSQNAHFTGAVTNGTLTTPAIAVKTGLSLADWGMTIMDGNWPQIVDTANGSITRFVCSASLAAIRIALTPLPNSPANLGMPIIVGTNRIPSNSQVIPNPYTDGAGGEKNQLEKAGLNAWTNDTAGAFGFALMHNKNSLGKNAAPNYTGNIVYGRVIQFTIASFVSAMLGSFVGLAQSVISPTDKTRRDASALSNTFILDRIDEGIYDAESFAVCDLTNNNPATGGLRIDLNINQNGIIDIVAVGIISGVGLFVSVTPGQTVPSTS